jgi:hypothetical protein
MHSPLYMYETENRDRVNSYHWQREVGRLEARRKVAGSWLANLASQVQATASSQAAAAKQTAQELGFWSRPPGTEEQCC